MNIFKKFMLRLQSINNYIAITLTNGTSTMWCAYFFLFLAILGWPDTLTMATFIQWLSTICIQLVMLSVIQVGASLLSGGINKMISEMYEWIKTELAEIKDMHKDQHKEIQLLKELCSGCKYSEKEK